MSGSCRLLCYRIQQKLSDYLSLVRDRKHIIVVIILLSHGIYMNDIWRPGGTVLWIWTWLVNRARLGLHWFRLCQLRTVRCCGWQLGHRLIILSTYLQEREGSLHSCRGFRLFPNRLIGGGERWRSKHHTESVSQLWGLGVQVWTRTWTHRQEWNGLVLFVPGVQARRVFRGTQLGYIDS